MGYKGNALSWHGILRKSHKDHVSKGAQSAPKQVQDLADSSHPLFAERYCKVQEALGPVDKRRVFLAFRKSDKLCVAVKVFSKSHHHGSEEAQTLKAEAEFLIGSQLNHVNIIRMIDLFAEPNGQCLQVMEYAPFNLFDRVGSRKMSKQEIDCAFMQVAAGLNYLHESGLAHRDVKLENIVYTRGGVMKIIDLGAATTYKRFAGRPIWLCNGYVGSLPYMAPEIIEGKPYDPRGADVWSLAIVYCCMVLGRFPWSRPSPLDRDFAEFLNSSSAKPITTCQISRDNAAATHAGVRQVISTQQDHKNQCDGDFKMNGAICTVFEVGVTHVENTYIALSQRLPQQTWPTIAAMLRTDSRSRPTMKQVTESSCFTIPTCAVRTSTGAGVAGATHEHI